MSIVLILAVGILIAFFVSILKKLYQVIMYKRSCGPSFPVGRETYLASNTNEYIPLNNFTYRALTSRTQVTPIRNKTVFNMQVLDYQHDRTGNFVFLKGLYSCVKINKKPRERVPEYSDSD